MSRRTWHVEMGDLGACGECELFGNDPGLLGDCWTMDVLGRIAPGLGDENDPVATGFCLRSMRDGLSLVAEDTPACERKVEPW